MGIKARLLLVFALGDDMKTILISFCLLIMFTVQATALEGNKGIGIVAGQPTGLTVKYWLDNARAVDGAVAWALNGHEEIYIHGDYLYHFTWEIPEALFYCGGGGRIKIDSDGHIGVRAPFGLSYLFPFADVFIEVAVILNLFPNTVIDPNLGLGGRYYF